MKILQVGLGNNPGGVEAFVMNYYRELAGNGISFDFVSMYGKIAYEEEIKSLGGRVFYVPNVKKDYFGYVKGMKALLAREGYDVVHVNMLSAANILPLRLAHEAGVKNVVAHSHNASAPGMLRKLLDRVNRPGISRYADSKLACGEKAGRWLFGDAAFEQGAVTLVSNAIDVEKYLFSGENRRRIREKYGFGEDFLVGHVGRFQAQKNHEAVLGIFRCIAEKVPEARLCLVGDGELLGQMKKKTEEYGLTEKVFFAGVRTDVEQFLSAMDVFLFPSLFEGLPFTLVEAQANGLPCVISDTITDEIVLDKGRVRKVSLTEAPQVWADCLLKCRSLPREDREAGKRLAQAHFDIRIEAKRLMELYLGEKNGK